MNKINGIRFLVVGLGFVFSTTVGADSNEMNVLFERLLNANPRPVKGTFFESKSACSFKLEKVKPDNYFLMLIKKPAPGSALISTAIIYSWKLEEADQTLTYRDPKGELHVMFFYNDDSRIYAYEVTALDKKDLCRLPPSDF